MPVLSPHHTSSSYRSQFNTSTLDRPPYYPSTLGPRITSYSERYSTRSYIDLDGRRTISRSGSITEDGITSRFKEEIRDGSVRRDSMSRDSGISSIRENSVVDFSIRRDRENSLTRDNSRLSSVGVIDDLTDLRNKYSPSNYVPAIHRKNENISRSKSINDIGLPPVVDKTKKKVTTAESVNANTSALPVTNTNNDNSAENDDNGNRATVADLRKRFDKMSTTKTEEDSNKPKLNGEKSTNGVKSVKRSNLPRKTPVKSDEETARIAKTAGVHREPTDESKPKQRTIEKRSGNVEKRTIALLGGPEKGVATHSAPDKILSSSGPERRTAAPSVLEKKSAIEKQKSRQVRASKDDARDVTPVKITSEQGKLTNGTSSEDGNSDDLCNGEADLSLTCEAATQSVSRTNNFASYISSKDLEGGDKRPIVNVVFEDNDDVVRNFAEKGLLKDLATSPKLNKNRISPSSSSVTSNNVGNSGAVNSNSLGRKSVERERRNAPFDDEIFDKSTALGYRLSSSSPTTVGAAVGGGVKTLGLNGLKNIGNTCFMNSVIQCLSNTKLLLEYLRHDAYIKDINLTNSSMKGSLIKAFAEVIKEVWSEDSCDRVVNTASLKGQIQRFAPRFMGYAQQDAQEFLRYLLEGLHEDVNRVTEKPKPIHTEIDDKLNDIEKSAESWNRYLRMDNSRIVDIFVGQLKSTLKCTHCGHCSVTFDPFWDLSLPIPTRTGQLRLSQCLEHFTREETLDGDEKPTCSKCKERRKCTKSFSIQKFPKILVIHLKRFSPTERFRGKLNVTVDFPLEALDMSKYAAEEVAASRYNLYAVSNHSGTTYSGHYTAYCRHPYAMTWHEYNDSRVSSVSPRSIVSSEAYVLFYEQEGQRSHL